MVFEATGRRSLQFETETAARRKRAALSRQFERNAPRTLAHMLDEYIEEKIDTGRALPHIARAEQQRILFLLGDSVTKDIRHVTPAWAAVLYRQLTVKRSVKTHQPLSAASHRCYLDYLKAFFGWAVQRSYVRRNPFADVRLAGKPNRGKRRHLNVPEVLQPYLLQLCDDNCVAVLSCTSSSSMRLGGQPDAEFRAPSLAFRAVSDAESATARNKTTSSAGSFCKYCYGLPCDPLQEEQSPAVKSLLVGAAYQCWI